MRPSLIVHGGAWDIPDDAIEACKAGCLRALHAGYDVLLNGGHALDAIEASITVLEDDPVFDAGYGSHLNLDGYVECDAIVMDASTLRAGAIAGLRRIKNPIQVARAVLEKCPHMMLISQGAEQFAFNQGIPLCNPVDLISPAEHEAWERCRKDSHAAEHHRGHEQGTVGAVALDEQGRLYAATSTGGTCCKLPGRVGDSPLIGCGCYADAETGAVSSTGYGEAIMKVVLAKTACDFLRPASSNPTRAAQAAVQLLERRGKGTGGLILLDKSGNPGYAFNTPRMAYGIANVEAGFITGV
ncbi:MAG TPA: isoaspartyl peptidase/L-asparaginase [Candidatus Bathyarchaeia archaeon]|nr:isoaspartyl peptidase/L-asparaginase [Candidatus Bathyarchaeia archaeon]